MAQLRPEHVNYLIWRYLQENGYGKTAVQLERDWGNDPKTLPFSQEVKPHTLISALQDALNYDDLLASIQSSAAQTARAPTYEKRYKFVVDRKRPAEDDAYDTRTTLTEIASGARKRQKLDAIADEQQQQQQRQTPTSRPSSGRRKSAKVTPLNLQPNGDSMDVDVEEEANEIEVEEEVHEEPRIPTPVPTLDIGISIGTQNEDIIDKKLAKSVFKFDVPGADILSCRWSYTDPLECTATGGSIWQTLNLPTQSSSVDVDEDSKLPEEISSTPQGPQPPDFYVSATDEGGPTNGLGSGHLDRPRAFAWTSTQEGYDGHGRLIFEKLKKRTQVDCTWNTILFIRFNQDCTLLLTGSANDDGQGLIRIYDISSVSTSSAPYHHVTIAEPNIALNATFSSSNDILTCGENFLSFTKLQRRDADSSSSAEPLETTHSNLINTNQTWELLAYSAQHSSGTHAACAAPDTGFIGLLALKDLSFNSKQAHDQQVTSLLWQPRPRLGYESSKPLLASSSTDGTVKLWSADDALECVHVLNMDPWVPAMALAFNVDGRFVAAAGARQIKAWSIDDRATLGMQLNGDADRAKEDDELLAAHWNDPDEVEEHKDEGDRAQLPTVPERTKHPTATSPKKPVPTIEAEPSTESAPDPFPDHRPRKRRISPATQALHDEMQIDVRSPTQSPRASKPPMSRSPQPAPAIADANGEDQVMTDGPAEEDVNQNGGDGDEDESIPPFHTLSFNSDSTLLSYTYGSKIHIINVSPQCHLPTPSTDPAETVPDPEDAEDREAKEATDASPDERANGVTGRPGGAEPDRDGLAYAV
ncbi:MAG: hypothetical protein M1828_007546 [Chrysothrix sp. TS-e1954]|nr:MAG: hypothetical protein M1828_007546 [Chrysothrix sp. TS-e1954]